MTTYLEIERIRTMTDEKVTICGHGSGTPRLANLRQYSSNRYKQVAPNGVRKGIVAVKRLKSLTDAGRKKYVDAYHKIIGRNIYHQGLREYVFTPYNGKYYSDCSSSQTAALSQAGEKVPMLNTAGIYNSSLFITVNVKIKEGHIVNPEVLKVGDLILFAGNDPSRPKQIGHVEGVYAIAGETQAAHKPEVQYAQHNNKDLAGKYRVSASSLNLRYGAGKQFEVITVLSHGQEVTSFGYYNSYSGTKWLYVVTADGTVGYASMGMDGQYLERI